MTVGELINALSNCFPDMKVLSTRYGEFDKVIVLEDVVVLE